MGGDRSMRAWALVGLVLLGAAAQALAVPAPVHAGAEPGGPVTGSGPAALAPSAPDTPWWSDAARVGADRTDPAIARIETQGWSAVLAPSGMPRYAVREAPDGFRYDVFVRFEADPGPMERSVLTDLGFGPVTVFPLAQAVHVQNVSFQQVGTLLALPGAVAVELERSVVPFLDLAVANTLVVPHENIGAGARERWKADGRDTVLAVLDTGIDKEHEVFDMERYLGGYDATVPTGRIGDELLGGHAGTQTPLNERDPEDDYYLSENNYAHGTHMASILLGEDPNGTYTGVAPGAKFLDVKVISNVTAQVGLPGGPSGVPYGWGSYVMEGLEFVHRYNNGESHLGETGRDKVDVALMALGETEADLDGTSVLSHAVNRLVGSGVTVVAAAGNCGPNGNPDCAGNNNTIAAPGAAQRAITVGSLTHNGTVGPTLQEDDEVRWDESLSAFSSRGPNGGEPKPNLVAYGEPVRAAKGEPDPLVDASNGYRVGNGTSQAAAQIAGIAALMLEVNRDLTPDELKSIMVGTARQPGSSTGSRGFDEGHGEGAVDALFAVGVAFGAWTMDSVFTRRGQNAEDQVDPDDSEDDGSERLVNQAPISRYHFRPGSPRVGESVVFIDRSLDPDRDDLVSFAWDFGDGNTGKGARSAHVYQKEGEYRVVLTVTDVHGTAGSWYDTVQVRASPEVEESTAWGLLWPIVALVGVLVLLRRTQKGVGLGTPPEPMGSI